MSSIKLSVSKVKIREYIETCMKSFIFYKQKEKIICILFCTIKKYNDVFTSFRTFFLHFGQCVANVI